ncbi:MAG: ABC transporter ATP-binding protein [Limnohabitans sp.]|nr:ABC transporter ATP-binding protein [Limnohabitans sp.]
MSLSMNPSQTNPDTVISIHEVGHRFTESIIALKNISLSISQGEFVAFLGASGCGKSTLLRIIAGLDQPTSGFVKHHRDQESTESFPIGFVFQDPTLMPWTTVFENIRLPLRLAGVSIPDSQRLIQEQIALLGLQGFEQAYPRQLSGGMKMRVSIARSLITTPRVLLMDEPFAALDEITRMRLNDDLLALCSKQLLTTLFVTHSVFESVSMAQKIVIMSTRPGRIVEVIDNPKQSNDPNQWRTSAEFAQRCAHVSNVLRMHSLHSTGEALIQ